MITLTTEQAQQIEEALEDIVRVFKFETGTPVEALATIHAARAQGQAEQEPVMDYERINALREGEQNGAEDAYFFVRPENDTPTLRKMFCQGFERGFHKGLKYASHVRTKDLTDDEIMKINVDTAGIVPTCDRQFHFARAVIAADREKNHA